MKLLARTADGGMIIQVSKPEAETISTVMTALEGLTIEMPEMLAPRPPSAPASSEPAKEDALHIDLTHGEQRPQPPQGEKRFHVVASKDRKTGQRVGEIRKDITSSGNSRNKKCAACGAAFTDETRANLRKFCGIGRCLKATVKQSPKAAAKLEDKTAKGGSRNKKCIACGHLFYDDSQTNVRKFCGQGGCRRSDTRFPGADRPIRDGRVLRVGSGDMSGAGEG